MLTRISRSRIMKALLLLSLFLATPIYAAEQSFIITDGASLKRGLDIYFDSTREANSEDTIRAVEAATYTQAFGEACYAWQSTAPDKAPFRLPPDRLNAEQFAKIVRKYLSDHPERLREKAQVLMFDALKSAFPRK
jgi:Rap1a immunity proteins